ncbi:MAG TPA: cytidylate kinase-like family protein [Myxococcota bacterium]|nr:cytidylate kinase-like family protein [Myxococcota bacterium]
MTQVLDELVGRQFRRWESARRSAGVEPTRPCVALSRLPSAGAEELGERVADRLGYAFFGIEIVDHIARRAGLHPLLVAGVDEHVRSAIERYVVDATRRERFTESDYLRHLVRTIASLGERGGAVILGRGAQFILPPERALRVLVVAPREARLERLMKQERLGRAEADARLAALDRERRTFLLHHFRRDPDAPEHYDLVVNLGTYSQEAAVELVQSALRARFGPAHRA